MAYFQRLIFLIIFLLIPLTSSAYTTPHYEYSMNGRPWFQSAVLSCKDYVTIDEAYHFVSVTNSDAQCNFKVNSIQTWLGISPHLVCTTGQLNGFTCSCPEGTIDRGTLGCETPELTDEQKAQKAAEDAAAAAIKAAEQKAADDAKAADAKAAADAKNAADKAAAASAAADAKAKADKAAADKSASDKAASDAKAAQDKADADAADPAKTPEQKAASNGAAATAAAQAATKAAEAATAAAQAATAAGQAAAAQKEEQQPEFCELHPSSIICKNSSINAGYCASGKSNGFSCDGDAIQCAIAKEQQIANCKFYEKDDALKTAYDDSKSDTNNPADNSNRENLNVQSSITVTSAATGSCPIDKTFIVNGQSFTLKLSTYCPYLEFLGNFVLILAYLGAAKIIGGSV